MNRFDCMQRLAARLKDELVVLSLGASVDEWYNAAPHMRSASLFQQQLGCVTPQAFGWLSACRTGGSSRSIPTAG
jgi:sulfopyruvate decarboxylase subunit beta